MRHNKLLYLAARVRHGDGRAAVLFRKLLEPVLVYIVGYTLRYGMSVHKDLTPRILAEARERENDAGLDRDAFLGQVAHAVCEWIIDGLRSGSGESLRFVETVCA